MYVHPSADCVVGWTTLSASRPGPLGRRWERGLWSFLSCREWPGSDHTVCRRVYLNIPVFQNNVVKQTTNKVNIEMMLKIVIRSRYQEMRKNAEADLVDLREKSSKMEEVSQRLLLLCLLLSLLYKFVPSDYTCGRRIFNKLHGSIKCDINVEA